MSVDVKNLQGTLDSLAALKSRLEGTQAEAKETLLRSLDGVSDKVVENCTAGAAEATEGAAQMHAQAVEMLQQADALIVEAGNPDLAPEVADSLSGMAAQLAAQAQQTLAQAAQYVEYGEDIVKQAQEVANHSSQGPEFGWTEMLLMAGIGFGIVFLVLVLLIFIMKFMGWIFTRQKKAAKVAKAAAAGTPVADDEHEAITDQEIAAAIMTALKLYKSNLHDQESEMLTIHRITRAYSPWSSKIHGLTQLPERK